MRADHRLRYDFVPGNLAGALALERAGDAATSVHVGYFFSGSGGIRGAASGGTLASLTGIMLEPQPVFRDGRVQSERAAARVRSFSSGSKQLTGVSIGASEHFALPRERPGLREVDVYLGWFGPASRGVQAFSAGGEIVSRVPGVREGYGKLAERLVKGSTGGPDAESRSKTGSLIFAEARDASGRVLSEVELRGPNGYTFTGDILAWGARRAAEHGLEGTGALGPVDAFGLRVLEAGCAEVGLRPTS